MGATRDVRVRQAIAAALDYKALAGAWHNEFPPATSFLPPPIVRWKSVAVPPYQHDLKAAIALLRGVTVKGLIGVNSEDPINVRIATLVQEQLARAGMQVSIKANPTRIWFSPDGLLRNGQATIAGETWVGGGDPEQSLNLRCVQAVKGDENHSFYCSKRFEALFNDQATTPSQAQRDEDFNKIQLLIHDDVPVIPLYYEARLIGVRNRVTGYNLNMLWLPVNVENWDAR
jgi:peptide/nickel transport system substrate-binding protein